MSEVESLHASSAADAAPRGEPSADSSRSDSDPPGANALAPAEEARRAQEQSQKADAEDEERPLTRWLPAALAVGFPLILFFLAPPLSRSGLWDPFELNVADFARRIAVNLYGATDLALSGVDNSLPHLNDLAKPELPFTSMALGFKLFGLHEWAGRLPLALWGLAGVVATFGAVTRLVDKRAGMYAAVALSTMPLYFAQARTMLGDVVGMSALALAFGGLAVGVFDRDAAGPRVTPSRLAWLALGALGLVAGFYSRGGLLGVAVPTLTVGFTWVVLVGAARGKLDLLGHGAALVTLAVGLAATFLAVRGYGGERTGNLDLWFGGMIRPPGKYPTFDVVLGHMGHAMAPWSAFAPFALGRLFLPPLGRAGSLFDRESITRSAVLLGTAVAFTAQGYLVARTDFVPFVGPVFLAVAIGIALRDYERGAHPSVAVAVGTAVLLAVLHHDFHNAPEKSFQALGVLTTQFPEGFKVRSLMLWWVALGGFAIVTFFTWVERGSDRVPFAPKNYVAVLDALRKAWDGLLVVAYYALVAGAAIAGFVAWFGTRNKWKIVAQLSSQIRELVVHAWWVAALAPFAAVFGLLFLSDTFLWAFGRAGAFSSNSLTRGFEPFEDLFRFLKDKKNDDEERMLAASVLVPAMVLAVPGLVFVVMSKEGVLLPIAVAVALPSGLALFLLLGLFADLVRGRRAAAMLLAALVGGGTLCCAYYPALAAQLSPKDVFESYQRRHVSGEPLGLFGVGGRTAAYYAGGQPANFTDAPTAFHWLLGTVAPVVGSGSPSAESAGPGATTNLSEPTGPRRFLAVRAEELARLNQLYRESTQPRRNLPVLDARSSQIYLVASHLVAGETSSSPLDKIVLADEPSPTRRLDVNMDDHLLVLGQDLTDSNGRAVDAVSPGKKYHLRTFMKVLAPLASEWEAFIHIDGFKRRHNGDHKSVEGKLPMTMWLRGDTVVDDYEFSLEPNFTPGTYTVFFGFFAGDTRMHIKSGPNDGDNRINGGPLRVQ